MARRRFFVERVHNGEAALEGEAGEHLRKVLRAEPGQLYELSDNQSVYLARIESFQKGFVKFRLLEQLDPDPPQVKVILLASLVKFDRFEWLIEKATELGVEEVVPVVAARSEKGLDKAVAARHERWRRIALESSQQSRRSRLPLVSACIPFEAALGTEGRYRFLLDESRNAPAMLTVLPEPSLRFASDSVCLMTGPEGGWIEDERRLAAEAEWRGVSLGPQILRAETASIAGLAVIVASWHL